MAVINIRKDGTVIEDMSKVTVPEEIVKNIVKICEGRKQDGKQRKLQMGNDGKMAGDV